MERKRSMKPILFNTEMVWAILDGRKTVTRRVVMPQPLERAENPHKINSGNWYFDIPDRTFGGIEASVGPYRPPCRPGDILYVRETWRKDVGRYMYKANYSDDEKFYRDGKEIPIKWRPSTHMPKEAARLFLRVKDVRVEQLQKVGTDGAIKEGVANSHIAWLTIKNFADLWDSTIRPADRALYGWEANPWVWVIEFEGITKEEAEHG